MSHKSNKLKNLQEEENSHRHDSISSAESLALVVEEIDAIHFLNPVPQTAPGASAAVGHKVENSIPLSIFPIQADKHCICLCGLPGRGKTHIARRLARYLSFFHAIPTKVFNVAEYRRRICGALKDAQWFDSTNEEASELRNQCNTTAIHDMVEFLSLHANGVVILDSTNPTHSRRQVLHDTMKTLSCAKVLFIEVNNTDTEFLQEQYRNMARDCPDYAGINDAEAQIDFAKRVENYASFYENMDDKHPVESRYCFFKCDHSRDHYEVHNVKGYLPLKVIHFIMNMRTTTHSVFMSRHGQSEYNELGRIGGDSGLSQHGLNYAKKLAEFVEEKITHDEATGNEVPARLWTSSLRRTKETAQFIKTYKIIISDDQGSPYEWEQMRARAWHHLDELFAGSCDGMTYEEIEAQFPDEWERRKVDKLAYRYPRGESYLDVIARLEPMIIELERHREPVLIIAHQGILRIIYAFYKGLTRNEAPHVSIPLNTVIKLTPTPYECFEE
eukprot:gene1059-2075_t